MRTDYKGFEWALNPYDDEIELSNADGERHHAFYGGRPFWSNNYLMVRFAQEDLLDPLGDVGLTAALGKYMEKVLRSERAALPGIGVRPEGLSRVELAAKTLELYRLRMSSKEEISSDELGEWRKLETKYLYLVQGDRRAFLWFYASSLAYMLPWTDETGMRANCVMALRLIADGHLTAAWNLVKGAASPLERSEKDIPPPSEGAPDPETGPEPLGGPTAPAGGDPGPGGLEG